MTEGPQARAHAVELWRRFGGQLVVDASERAYELIGRKLTSTTTIGKNILLLFDDTALRIHLLMYGRLEMCEGCDNLERVRLILRFEGGSIAVRNQSIIELGPAEQMVSSLEAALGPDPLFRWSEEEAFRRIRARGEEKIGSVLLDQTVIAGMGNILRNEVLFLAGVSPERLVKEMSDDEVMAVVRASYNLTRRYTELLIAGVNPKVEYAVYGRAKKACPRCGSQIKMFYQKPHGRKTYFCPACQK